MRAILATLALGGLLALVALPAALGRPASSNTNAAISATLRAASKSTKVVTVKNLGPGTIVEIIIESRKGFAIKGVKSGPAGGSCGPVAKTGIYTNVDCKTKLPSGKSTAITLETKQQGSGPAEAQVGVRLSGGGTFQATIVREGK